MLPGLRSRCTTRREWSRSSAATTSLAHFRRRGSVRRCSGKRHSCRCLRECKTFRRSEKGMYSMHIQIHRDERLMAPKKRTICTQAGRLMARASPVSGSAADVSRKQSERRMFGRGDSTGSHEHPGARAPMPRKLKFL